METRKCPHFIEGLDSLLFTNDGIKWWKKYMNLDTSKWKNYGYSHEHTEKFLKRIGEYHILCHIYEPFGYSIFHVIWKDTNFEAMIGYLNMIIH